MNIRIDDKRYAFPFYRELSGEIRPIDSAIVIREDGAIFKVWGKQDIKTHNNPARPLCRIISNYGIEEVKKIWERKVSLESYDSIARDYLHLSSNSGLHAFLKWLDSPLPYVSLTERKFEVERSRKAQNVMLWDKSKGGTNSVPIKRLTYHSFNRIGKKDAKYAVEGEFPVSSLNLTYAMKPFTVDDTIVRGTGEDYKNFISKY